MMSEFDLFTPDPEAVKAWVEKHLMPKRAPVLVWRGRHPDVAKGADGKMFTAIEENIQAEHHDKPRTVPSQNNIPWNRRTWPLDPSAAELALGLSPHTPIEVVMTDNTVWLRRLSDLRASGWARVRKWRILLPHETPEEPLKAGMKGVKHWFHSISAGAHIRLPCWTATVEVLSIDHEHQNICVKTRDGGTRVCSWKAFDSLRDAP